MQPPPESPSEMPPEDAGAPRQGPTQPAEVGGFDPYQPPREEPSGGPVGKVGEPAQEAPAFLSRPGPALGVGCGGCLVYFVLAQLVPGFMIGIWIAVSGGGGAGGLQAKVVAALPLITGFGVVASIAIVLASRRLKWLDEGPPVPDALWKVFAWTIFAAVLAPVGAHAISWVQTYVLELPMQEQEILVQAAETAGIGFWLAIVIGAPLGEELFFRRWFYGITRRPLGPWLAFLASGVAFALIHFNFSATLGYLWIAACCTFAYERSGSIWGAIFVHFVNNSIAAAFLAQAGG